MFGPALSAAAARMQYLAEQQNVMAAELERRAIIYLTNQPWRGV